jgi:superfamily II DNA/RNA helicase
MSLTFEQLNMPPPIVAELGRQMRTEPFPIQAATIPDVLAGRDVLGRAPTGSGKTLAFGLPTLVTVAKAGPGAPRALILSPTRELAEQIRTELGALAKTVDRTVAAVYGGTSFAPQVRALSDGVDILVACPGRLEDLIDQGIVSLDAVDKVIIDEADRMADMGFLPSVRRLVDQTDPSRQIVLFSATLDSAVQVLVDDYLTDPVTHSVGKSAPDLSKLAHRFWKLEKTERVDRAAQVIDEHGSTILFCRTRHGVDRVAQQLKSRGVKTAWIHGGRTQGQRNAALHAFTSGKTRALVATDVAARGIHVDDVACVIHYDPPADHKDYVHRSGRTARAGGTGVVFSFLMQDQIKTADKLRQALKLPGQIEDPPVLPSWIKENQTAYAAKTGKSPRQKRPNKPKPNGATAARTPTKPKPKSAAETPLATEKPGAPERTKKPKKPKVNAGRSGRKRPPKTGANKRSGSSAKGRRKPIR